MNIIYKKLIGYRFKIFRTLDRNTYCVWNVRNIIDDEIRSNYQLSMEVQYDLDTYIHDMTRWINHIKYHIRARI